MNKQFQNVGVLLMASTKRSLRIELNNLPYTTFQQIVYVSIKDVEAVLNHRKKTATLWIINKDPDR